MAQRAARDPVRTAGQHVPTSSRQRRLSWTRPCVQTRLRVAGRARPRSKTVWVSILVPPISSGVAFGEFGNQPDLSFPSVPMGITLGTTSEGCPEDWRALQSKH